MQQVQSADGRALMHVLSGLTRLRRALLLAPAGDAGVVPDQQQTGRGHEPAGGGHRRRPPGAGVQPVRRSPELLRARIAQKQWDYCYLDGGCSTKSRQESILRFRHEAVPLFLISLKAGGTGLNLTQADTVLHLDPGGTRRWRIRRAIGPTAWARPSR